LQTGEHLPAPTLAELNTLLTQHLHDHYAFYGERSGVRSARKHIAWYLEDFDADLGALYGANSIQEQLQALGQLFDEQHERLSERLALG
jgi:tRNA-dihydrouridine synthase B